MKIIYSGFDSIYFAAQGALRPEAEQQLSLIKEQAIEKQDNVAFTTYEEDKKFILQPNGKKGGYTYVVDTGHLGSVISFKSNLSRTEWNGFVEIKSASLLSYGYERAIEIAFDHLKALGFHKESISMNRVDYCIDFLNANLRLDPRHFLAHSRVKKTSHYESKVPDIHVNKSSVAQSDHVQSVTLGKMPGRQVIVYDKRAEVIEKRKTYWFKAWGIDRNDPTLDVYRVEIRAAKRQLNNDNISSLDDFKRSIGLTLLNATKAVRYVIPNPNDSNISRAPLHPVWKAVQYRLGDALSRHQAPIDPPIILEHMRRMKALEYEKQVVGNLGGWLGCKGTHPDHVAEEIESVLKSMASRAQDDSQHPLWKSYHRTNDKWREIS